MGVTFAYRGRLADLTRIEDFEDRLVDCALEIGGLARIWRSWADGNPDRLVRGVILDLAPGHESTSLLVSPEGWLTGLTDIEDAENGRLEEPPWCFVKTQFGPVEGHVALVEMFAALKREFLSDLEISDEGGYWETRDFAELVRKRSLTKQAIDGLADGLRRYGLSSEAAEDPAILLRHIERVAAQVHGVLRRPSERAPIGIEGDDGGAADPEATERLWDDLSKNEDESVKEGAGFHEAGDHRFEIDEAERHPLLQQAMDLLVRFDTLFRDAGPRFASSLSTLNQGAGDAMGGLAQALSRRDDDIEDYGLCVVQLKRALRGVAFARGALFPLRSTISAEQFDEVFHVLKQMETDILSELAKVRQM
jgi:hypothetical protein